MNTRVFKDISKYQHRAWLGFTTSYNGGGSKLKAVCGEFRSLYDELKAQSIEFI